MGKIINMILATGFGLGLGSCGMGMIYETAKSNENHSPEYIESICQVNDSFHELNGMEQLVMDTTETINRFFGVEQDYAAMCAGYESRIPLPSVPEHYDCTTMSSNDVLNACQTLAREYRNCEN